MVVLFWDTNEHLTTDGADLSEHLWCRPTMHDDEIEHMT